MAASVREAARVLADFVEKIFQSGLHVSGNPKVTDMPAGAPHPFGPTLARTLILAAALHLLREVPAYHGA